MLKVERSTSNYRYYDHSMIERLHYIEKCKQDGMSLDEIKKIIVEQEAEEVDVLELRLKIQGLEKDVAEILAHLDKNDLKKIEKVKKNVSNESLSLIQALLLLIKWFRIEKVDESASNCVSIVSYARLRNGIN